MGKKIRIFGIDWETDGEDVNLPDEVIVDPEEVIDEGDMDNLEECVNYYASELADYLSDSFDFLVNSFRTEIIDK